MDCLQGTRSCRQLEETSPKHKRRGTGKFTLLWLQQSLQRVNQTIKNPMGTHHCSRINPLFLLSGSSRVLSQRFWLLGSRGRFGPQTFSYALLFPRALEGASRVTKHHLWSA